MSCANTRKDELGVVLHLLAAVLTLLAAVLPLPAVMMSVLTVVLPLPAVVLLPAMVLTLLVVVLPLPAVMLPLPAVKLAAARGGAVLYFWLPSNFQPSNMMQFEIRLRSKALLEREPARRNGKDPCDF